MLSTDSKTISDSTFSHERLDDHTSRSQDIAFSGRVAAVLPQNNLIQTFFVAYNTSYPIFDERIFREQCTKRTKIPARSAWHICYYMVLAIGEWISGFCTDEQSLYYEAARARLGVEILESGSVETVQALLLVGNYLQKRDRPNTGYNYIGLAYRVALGLGLHREVLEGGPFTLQRRRKVFWVLYCFESGFSLTTGRPSPVADCFIDIRKPGNIDDSAIDSATAPLNEVNYPTTSSAIAAQARLASIANKIYSSFLSANAPADVDHLEGVMEHSIQKWRHSLPDYFDRSDIPKWFLGPRAVVLWKESNIRILLLLASQRHQPDQQGEAATGSRCQAVAAKAVFEIAAFCRENPDLMHTGLSWYAVYFLLQATLAFGVTQLRRRGEARQVLRVDAESSTTWQTVYSSACQCLQELGHNNKLATQTMILLQRLHNPLTQADAPPKSVTSPTRSVQPAYFRGPQTNLENENGQQQWQEPQQPLASDWNSQNQMNAGADFALGMPVNEDTATNFIEGDWVGAVDPSLHVFFDRIDQVGTFLEGVQGFSNMMEQDDFVYTTSGTNVIRRPLE